MKHILLALVLLFGVTGVVTASDFEAGKDAFNKTDYATALEKFRKAAEAGNAKAQNWLAWMYYYGKGVPQNNQEAVRWYVKAAEAGHTIAQVSLGKMYELGRGVPPDTVQAYKWYNLAAAKTTSKETRTRIVERRDELAQQMTRQEIAEAQQLAREWKPVK